jgi:hypothetical protein
MANRLPRYGKQAVLGAKSAGKPAFPKGRPRGPTALRKAYLACPKTAAAIFLRVFESSFTLRVIAVSSPYFEATGDLPKII